MKTSYASATISAITLAIAALSAGQAVAQSSFNFAPTGAAYYAMLAERDGALTKSGKTREQVQAEMLQARADGDVVAPEQFSSGLTGHTGATYRELFPARFGVQAVADTKTRADVRAEYAEAVRNGDLPADAWIDIATGGVPGGKLRDVFPGRYPARANLVAGQQVLAAK